MADDSRVDGDVFDLGEEIDVPTAADLRPRDEHNRAQLTLEWIFPGSAGPERFEPDLVADRQLAIAVAKVLFTGRMRLADAEVLNERVREAKDDTRTLRR